MKNLLLFAVLACVSAFGQNVRQDNVALNRSGLPAPGALVAVCTQPATPGANNLAPCAPLANLCSSATDGICNSPNPVTADGLGNYFFYALPGTYTIQIYGSGLVQRFLPDQTIGGGSAGSGNVAAAQQFAMGYYPQVGSVPAIGGDPKITTDGNGNNQAQSYKTTGSGTGKIITGILNNDHYVSWYPGAPDLGIQINNCDTDLGATPGRCIVDISGTISTAVVFCNAGDNHTLYFMGGTTTTELASLSQPLSMKVGSSGCRFDGSGPSSIIKGTNTFYNGATFTGDMITIGTHTPLWNATVYTAVTVDTGNNATTVQVTSTTGMVAGQDVIIKESVRYAEFNVVGSVTDGTHVVLKYPTEHGYRASTSPVFATFAAGTLTKNFQISNLRITSTTCALAATGSNSGIAIYVATEGTVENVWVDCVGGRGILTSASGYPTARISIINNHVLNAGLVPAGTGSPGIEDYTQSSHISMVGNQVRSIGGHGISTHGFFNIVQGNNAWWTGLAGGVQGYCYSTDTSENTLFSGNIGNQCALAGMVAFGSNVDQTSEATRITFTGNIISDPGGDCYDFGTVGSAGFMRVNASNNTCLRPRGTNGFLIEGSTGGYQANSLSNNTVEGATVGYQFGQTALGVRMMGNHCRICTTAYSLNSPSTTIFIGNTDDTSTTALALGTADFSTFIGYATGTITGTFGANSTVWGYRGTPFQLPTGAQALSLNGNPLTGLTSLTSFTANPSATGVVRLASGDAIGWRNNANAADIFLDKNASDQLRWNGSPLVVGDSNGNLPTSELPAMSFVQLGGATGVAAGVGSALNANRVWAYTNTVPVNGSTKFSYDVQTADNSADTYDMGIYNSAGTLLCHTGSTAGTTLFPSGGIKIGTWTASCNIPAGQVYFAITAGTAGTAVPGGLSNSPSVSCGVATATGNVTSGGTLNSSVTFTANALVNCTLPNIAVSTL